VSLLLGEQMARTATLLELRTQARQRADKVGSGYILDSELTTYINQSISELYDLLVGAYGNDYYLTSTTFATNNTDTEYNLPSDFYKLAGVDLYLNASRFITLKPFMWNERGRYQDGSNWAAIIAIQGPRYHIGGNKITFNPTPPGTFNIKMYYVPYSPKLVADSDAFDGIDGWEEFVVIDAAIKMLQKEETDVTVLALQKKAIIQRINTMAENRDEGHSFRVQDVQRMWNEDLETYRY
jgi:hypothetical protein